MRDEKAWVVLDGDDTLWRTTPLYDRAKHRLGEMAGRYGADPSGVIAWAEAHDVEQAAVLGYSMHRFPSTLRAAALRFLEGSERAEELALAASGLGYGVYAEIAEPNLEARDLIELLAPTHRLALMTAGETTIQEKRILDFPWKDRFDAIRVVTCKDTAAFAGLAAEFGMAPSASWMVGDSLRSDILPATAAGFNAVHFDTSHWAAWERVGHLLPEGAFVATSLLQAASIILERDRPLHASGFSP